MNIDERRQRVIERLATVRQELQSLAIDHHIFNELQEIIRANEQLQKFPGLFTQWMASGYVHVAALGVRRQVKTKDSVSLKGVLEEIKEYPEIVSRDYYLSCFRADADWLKEAGNREFDGIASDDGKHIHPKFPESDIATLSAVAADIEHYADRRVAHYDQRGLARPTPVFGDVDRCLEVMEKIFQRYYLFLTATLVTGLLPAILYDWKAIFALAWMPGAAPERSTR